MADGYNITRYRPTNDRAVYNAIMNSEKVQALLLKKARLVAAAAGGEGIATTADVRPGKHRAHARAKARLQKVYSFRARGHNRRVDRILQASIDAARG